MKKLLIICLLAILFDIGKSIDAAIESTTGSIGFDVNKDGQLEAALSSNGLAIGQISPSANLHVLGNAIISNTLSIGGTQSHSTLTVNGSIGYGLQLAASSLILGGNSTIVVDTASSNIVVSLPDASDHLGQVYRIIKKNSNNHLVITGSRVDLADRVEIGSGNVGSLEIMASGNQWYLLGKNNLSITSSSNLIAWWPLNESTGSELRDHSSYTSHLTMSNFETSANGHIVGKIGNGIVFDGSDDVVNVSDPADGHFNVLDGGNLTVSFWFKSTTTANRYLMHKGGDGGAGNEGFYVTFSGLGMKVQMNSSLGTPVVLNQGLANGVYNDGNWHHALVIIDRTVSQLCSLYLDNSLISTKDISALGNMSNNKTLTVGGYPSIPSFSEGNSLDEIRLYNKILSSSEIKELYELGN